MGTPSFPRRILTRTALLKSRNFLFLFSCSWFFSSCSSVAIHDVTAAFTNVPLTATYPETSTAGEKQIPSLTRTPTQEQTRSATLWETPTHTPTVTPFSGLQFTGPFLVLADKYANQPSLTFFNFIGTANWTVELPITLEYDASPVNNGLSPDWRWFAYVTGSVDERGTYPEGGIVLHVQNLLTGEIRDIASLVPQDYLKRLEGMARKNDPYNCESISEGCLYWAAGELEKSIHSIAWSPDGKYLAFSAMVDDDSADTYRYDLDTGKIRRLEWGPGNPQSFTWSPDSQWVVYEENDIPSYEPEAGVWTYSRRAVRRDGGESKKLPGPVVFYYWFSDYEYVASVFESNLYSNLTLVNIQTGYSYTCYAPAFSYGYVDPRSRLMAVLDYSGTEIYFGMVYHALDIHLKFKDVGVDKMGLSARGGTLHPLIGWYGDRWFGITPEGKIDDLNFPVGYHKMSPDYWLAIFSGNGIRIYDPSDTLRYSLETTNDYRAVWDTNSRGIFFVSEDKIHYWNFKDATPRLVASLPVNRKEGFLYIAPIINIKSLPSLRILPTRATKPAEGESIWNRTAYKELFQPGTNRYNVTIPDDSSWRWSFSLGTTDPSLFEKILLPEDVEFRINGEWIDSNMFRMTDQTAEGRFSRAWAAMLSGWRPGDRAELEIKYTLREAVRDGNVTYPAGEYRQIISVVVE